MSWARSGAASSSVRAASATRRMGSIRAVIGQPGADRRPGGDHGGLDGAPQRVFPRRPPRPGACKNRPRPLTSADSAGPVQVPAWPLETTVRLKLSELLTESAVVHELHGRDKWAVIDVLTDLLVDTGQVRPESRDTVRDSLVAREKAMSTGMEHGVAIPHASVAEVERPAVAMGVAPEGVDFQ